MIRTLVADDHAIVREGIKKIVAETPDIIVADEADNGQEVIDKALRHEYDVLLLDISMPGRTGLDVLQYLKSEKPKLPVLMLSIHSEARYAIRSLRAGAFGYLTKESAPDELITAIRTISSGRRYITPTLAAVLAEYLDTDVSKPLHETLSDREYQVLRMLASGKTVTGIAEEMCLSPKTISTYRSRILQKMRMENNAELTHYAIDNRLVG
jgi:DNA-binding NarL/FixJ family response regulator